MTDPFSTSPLASPEQWTAHLIQNLAATFEGRSELPMRSRHSDRAWLVGRHVLSAEMVRSWLVRRWIEHRGARGTEVSGVLELTPLGQLALDQLPSLQRDDAIGAHLTDAGREALSQLPSPQLESDD